MMLKGWDLAVDELCCKVRETAIRMALLEQEIEWMPEPQADGARATVAYLHAQVGAFLRALEIVVEASGRPRCLDFSCPSFGDLDFGDLTCPSDHASVSA